MALDFLTGCYGWRPTKLSNLDGNLTQAWIHILHVILIIPSAIAGFKARGYYRLTLQHPELSQLPYDENASLAFYLTYVGSVVIFAWIFLSSFLLLATRRREWTLLHGIINLALTVTVGMGTVMQARFLPANTVSCKGMNKPENQMMDGHYIFFSLFALITKNDLGKTELVCKSMINNWTTASSVVFFVSVLTYISIFFDEREYSLLHTFRPLVWFGFALFSPFFIVHWTLENVFPRIRLYISFARKSKEVIRSKESIDIPLQTQFKPQWEGYHIPKTKLMKVLNIEHVLLNVVEYMHRGDVVNLSLACRAVREAVYPAGDLEFRRPKLEKACCSLTPPSTCLYCNSKICTTCLHPAFYPGLPGRRHINCAPYCSTCYYASFAKRVQRPLSDARICKCHGTDRNLEFQDCCRACMVVPLRELQAKRQRRYERECVDIAYGVGARCGLCKRGLGNGMRWWRCGKCRGECRDGIHPGWIRRVERDVEKGEGREEDVRWWRWWRR